jgi:hypothetical protein
VTASDECPANACTSRNDPPTVLICLAAFVMNVLRPLCDEQPIRPIYAPEIGFEGWECTSSSLGSDGGALGVMDGLLHGAGNVCELTKPTQVRGMNAVLYDAVCDGEGTPFTIRMMLMTTESGILVMIDGNASELRSCK